MHWDWIIRGLEFLIVSGVGWKINRTINRGWDLLQEYPLHRHVGRSILYPKGMSPEDREQRDEEVSAKGRA